MKRINNIFNALTVNANLHKTELTNYIKVSNTIKAIREDELSCMPQHINVISISANGKLKETAHSKILQHLLKNQTILTSFLEKVVGLDNPDIKTDDVRPAERERIDVSIYGDNMCIIVENKVNNAIEQPGQIFRYVQTAMKDHGYFPKQIKVLYLNSKYYDRPTKYSLTKGGKGKENIPKGVDIIVRNYFHDIYKWVKGLSKMLPKSESYLQTALLQYQDYLEEKFYTTEKINNMKERIRFTINSEILQGISDEDDVDFSKRIDKLEDAIEDLQQLSDGINSLKWDLSVRREAYHIQKELTKNRLSLIDLKDYGYDEDNYGVRISINEKYGFLVYGYGKNGDGYIGFAFDTSSLSTNEKRLLIRIFKRFGKDNQGEEDLYPCWCWVDSTLLNEYVSFVRFIKKQVASENLPISFESICPKHR